MAFTMRNVYALNYQSLNSRPSTQHRNNFRHVINWNIFCPHKYWASFTAEKHRYARGISYFCQIITKTEMKKIVFWDLVPCSYGWNRRFGGMYRLHLQERWIATRIQWAGGCSSRRDSPALKMGAIRSSETSVPTITTRHQIPEDDFLHRHRRENLKSYKIEMRR
jgi:hypothetical protein